MGVMLRELDLMLRNRLPRAVEDDESRARRALVYGANEKLLQLLLVEVCLLRAVNGRPFEVVTLRDRLWLCAGC